MSKYTYETAGFNGMLSRSRKSNPLAMTLMDAPSTSSGTTVNLDRQQIAASLGDIMALGRIILDGVAGRIRIQDQNKVDTAWLGDLTP